MKKRFKMLLMEQRAIVKFKIKHTNIHSKVVEQLPRLSKVKGLNPLTAVSTGRKKNLTEGIT